MSSKLNKFTFNEAFNAVTDQNLGYDVQPLLSWAQETSIPVTATKFVDVSDTYKLTLQCGDWMHIKFASLSDSTDVVEDGVFNTNVPVSTTGTYWTTGSSWAISGGKALNDGVGLGTSYLTSTDSSLLKANTSYKLSFNQAVVNQGLSSPFTSVYVFGNASNGAMSGVNYNSSGNFYGDELITTDIMPTHDTSITFFAGSTEKSTSIDNVKIEEYNLINRSTDFAIPPGMHEMVVPKGVGDDMVLMVLPYNDYSEVLGSQYMRVVKHG